jgi:hydroxyacylglutathione hydrolase
MGLITETIVVGDLQCNCLLIGDEDSRAAVVVDPGDEAARILKSIARLRLSIKAILNTHAHFDHVGANQALKDATGAPLHLHPADLELYRGLPIQAAWLGLDHCPAIATIDRELVDGERLPLAGFSVTTIHTPGHSPGSVCFLIEGSESLLVSGDTLFAGGIGRTDLPGGSYEQELRSISKRLLPLDGRLRVVPGHGPETTITREKQFNPFLQEA